MMFHNFNPHLFAKWYQKSDYIHFNLCKTKLVELPEQYEHGSAKYYYTGEQGIYTVTGFMELRDVDLITSLT